MVRKGTPPGGAIILGGGPYHGLPVGDTMPGYSRIGFPDAQAEGEGGGVVWYERSPYLDPQGRRVWFHRPAQGHTTPQRGMG